MIKSSLTSNAHLKTKDVQSARKKFPISEMKDKEDGKLTVSGAHFAGKGDENEEIEF